MTSSLSIKIKKKKEKEKTPEKNLAKIKINRPRKTTSTADAHFKCGGWCFMTRGELWEMIGRGELRGGRGCGVLKM